MLGGLGVRASEGLSSRSAFTCFAGTFLWHQRLFFVAMAPVSKEVTVSDDEVTGGGVFMQQITAGGGRVLLILSPFNLLAYSRE